MFEYKMTDQNVLATPEVRFPRTSSRRSRAACSLCRWRKVRCDSGQGRPCSNCVFEKVDCTIPQRQPRKKTYAKRKQERHTSTDGRDTDSAQPAPDAATGGSSAHPTRTASIPSQETYAPFDMAITFSTPCDPEIETPHHQRDGGGDDDDDDDGGSGSGSSAVKTHHREACDFDWHAAAAESLPSPPSTVVLPGSQRAIGSVCPETKTCPTSGLPSFIKPIPKYLSSEDIDYLHSKGAFLIPEPDLCDELLQGYIDFIHPWMPLLDIDAFVASIESPSEHGPVSLLLFNAVMFAGSCWGDIRLVRRAGYWTRHDMRAAFYRRTSVLYALGYEHDRLINVQVLVLLSCWWDGWNEHRDGYYWCGLAHSVAFSLGIHDERNYQTLAPSEKSLRRRIWWTLAMRDTIGALGCNRGPRVREGGFNVSMLTSEDLLTQESSFTTTRWRMNRDLPSQRRMALLCIAIARLCQILSKIMEAGYTANHTGHIGILHPTQENYISEDSEQETAAKLERLTICEGELCQWWNEVSPEVLHESPVPVMILPDEQPQLVLRGFLSMMYFFTVFALNRPRAMLRMDLPTLAVNMEKSPQEMIREAALNTSKVTLELYEADLMRHLPGTALSCLLAFSFSHAHDLNSPDQQVRREAIRRLEECKLALGQLVDSHKAAKWGIQFVSLAISRVTHWNRAKRRQRALEDTEGRRHDLHDQSLNQPDAESRPTPQNKMAMSPLNLAYPYNPTNFGYPLSTDSMFFAEQRGLFNDNGFLSPNAATEAFPFHIPDVWTEFFGPFEQLTPDNVGPNSVAIP